MKPSFSIHAPDIFGAFAISAIAASICVACASQGPSVTPQQIAAAQATVAAVCSTEQAYADPKAGEAAAKRCAAEQALLAALQAAAGAAPAASAPR